MKNKALAPKITKIILIKLLLLFGLWKLFFSAPLPNEARYDGMRAIYHFSQKNSGELNDQ